MLQRLVGTWATPGLPLRDTLAGAIRELPAATNPAESLLQRVLVLQLLLQRRSRHPRTLSAAEVAFLHAAIEALAGARPDESLQSLLAGYAGTDLRGPTSPDALVVNRARAFIDAHFAEPITIAAIANALAVDRRAVQGAFVRSMGRPLRHYLAERRVAAALEHLAQGDDTKIETVAMLVGYRSRKNLNAAIRRFVGMTPGEIRGNPTEAWARFRALVDRRGLPCS